MISYQWTIKAMSVMPVLEGQTDVVVSAQWNILGQDQGASYNLSGWQNFTLEQGEGFVPYNQLTEAQVVQWVKDTLGENGVASMEAAVQGSLDAINNPPVEPVIATLPW
jgi:hypothetical protein